MSLRWAMSTQELEALAWTQILQAQAPSLDEGGLPGTGVLIWDRHLDRDPQGTAQ